MAIFVIEGAGAVETRELPSGDIAVKHAINERLRDIVEPICRGRGHWNTEYYNWIIFRQFADSVLTDLGKYGKRI